MLSNYQCDSGSRDLCLLPLASIKYTCVNHSTGHNDYCKVLGFISALLMCRLWMYNRRHRQIYYESTSGSVRNTIICTNFRAWCFARIWRVIPRAGAIWTRCLTFIFPQQSFEAIRPRSIRQAYILSDSHIPVLAYWINTKLFGLSSAFFFSFNHQAKSPWAAITIYFDFVVGFACCRLHHLHRRLMSCDLIWIFNLLPYPSIPFPESSFSAPFDLRTSNQLASARTRFSDAQANQIIHCTHSSRGLSEDRVLENESIQNFGGFPSSWVPTGLRPRQRQEKCRSPWDYQSKRLTAEFGHFYRFRQMFRTYFGSGGLALMRWRIMSSFKKKLRPTPLRWWCRWVNKKNNKG